MTIDLCHELTGSWFVDLPRVTDRSLARAYVSRFQSASADVQWTILGSYEGDAIVQPDPDSRFDAWRAGWRREHPDWP
jgi:hypothetical protein